MQTTNTAPAQTANRIATASTDTPLSSSLVGWMAITCGLVVANLYFNQPLLAEIGKAFQKTDKQVSWIATITQLGYTVGLLLVVPLGDKLERKKLILIKLVLAAISLAVVASSQHFYTMLIASLFVGIFSVVPQLLLPMAAQLARPEKRGKIVGTVMSGLLIGILLSRTISGYVGAHLGWRAIFWIGAVVMLLLDGILAFMLPKDQPVYKGTYSHLMRSLWTLVKDQAILRKSAGVGFMMFGAFSIFWTTLVFFLEGAPYHYKSDMVGLFGLIGACGAFAAPLAGKTADRKGADFTAVFGMLIALSAFVVMGIGGNWLIALILGVILLDIGMQVTHISNQSRVFALIPEARSRLNTVYMTSAFTGSSLGSLLGSMAWHYGQWPGVCLLGFVFIGTAYLINRN
ncbi:MFS transporter [Rapidithrix thailandica]|uniref:MFS transporter n=1 Tax=Rapidithrix thailandica TaxID=413964 RepID=A0AAW9SL64_9BACT